MKQLLAIEVHSFVDVITNSSTELFVCDTDKSLEQVEAILRKKLEAYNNWKDQDYVFEDIFETPYIYTQEMCDEASIHEYAWDYENQSNVGKLIIAGVEDNSIPYDMWDTINKLFDASNHHLG